MAKLELQSLFDLMDDMVATQRKAGSKSWLSTLRDAAAVKTAYAYGLRRRELAMLDLAEFGRNNVTVPEPFATLVRELHRSPASTTTAAHREKRWLAAAGSRAPRKRVDRADLAEHDPRLGKNEPP